MAALCRALPAPFLAGNALAVGSALTALFLAADDRRAISPPTTHSTTHRPSKDRPNQTAGDKMILEAQVPNATIASHSNLRSPLKYRAIGASARPTALDHTALVSSAPRNPGSDHAEQAESNAEGEQYGVNSRH